MNLPGSFDALRPFIAFVAKNICRLDDLVQRYDRERERGGGRFPYSLNLVYVDEPCLILEYCGMIENTTFDVVFRQEDGKFILEGFGMRNNLPPDWSVESRLTVKHRVLIPIRAAARAASMPAWPAPMTAMSNCPAK